VHGSELIVPLILAIEPDRQQAAQLTAIARSRIGAELVLADSAERALRDVGDRIPDLILTPQLLSPRDDAAIANRLRQLGTAAAYVQTLTIPALATTHQPGVQASARGLLSKLRRQKTPPADASGGCAPDVFAEQISVYLERALEARTAHAAAVQPLARVEAPPTAPIEAASAILAQFAAEAAQPASLPAPEVLPAPAVATSVLEPIAPIVHEDRPAETPLYIDVTPQPVVDHGERASDSLFRRRVEATPDSNGFQLQPEEECASDVNFRLKAEATPELKAEATPEPAPAVVPEPVLESPPVLAPPIVERPVKPAKPAPKKKARPSAPKNDWNFFNPEETRFAALLARLDEITRPDAGGHL
jgi:hypothetical protein